MHTSYLGKALNPNTDLFPLWEKLVNDKQVPKFHFIVGTGMSGTLSAQAMRVKYGYDIALLRREPENYEWKPTFEDTLEVRASWYTYDILQWILIDDCIGGGGTFSRVWKQVSSHYANSVCVGAFLFDWQTFLPRERVLMNLRDDPQVQALYDRETEIYQRAGSIQPLTLRSAKASDPVFTTVRDPATGIVRPRTLDEMESVVQGS